MREKEDLHQESVEEMVMQDLYLNQGSLKEMMVVKVFLVVIDKEKREVLRHLKSLFLTAHPVTHL